MTRNWVKVNDLFSGKYSVNKNIRFKTPILRSDCCDYRDACIVVKRTIDLLATGNRDVVNFFMVRVLSTNF